MQTPADVLADDGPLAVLIEGYARRQQQIEMAQAITAALENDESLICEAGTGTGKTFAYLIPAILSGRKTLISTATKHLQDQLFQKDLPLVRSAIGVPVNVALLKGRANYLCLYRLSNLEADGRFLSRHSLARLPAVRQWSQQTQRGDLSELTQLAEDSPLRPALTSNTENCLGQECPDYDSCFVFKARKRAADADIVVVNHHLFLSDMALRERGYGELLPAVDTVIFDEAHQLAELAAQFFSETLSSYQFLDLLKDTRTAYFAEAADLPELPAHLEALEKSVKDLRLLLGSKDQRTAWHVIAARQDLMDALVALRDKAAALHQLLEAFAQRGRALDNCFKRIDGILQMLDDFISLTTLRVGQVEPGADDYIQWVETRGQGFLLHRTPLNIAHVFQQRLADYDCRSVYTSATLAVNADFTHFASQLGLDEVKTALWHSPFDFARQAMLYIPPAMPQPREQNYTEQVIERAVPILELSQGRAFMLFTSHRALQEAAALIKARIDFPILVQGAAPRSELLENFRNTHHAVLLGTSSFWEGVDVKGQALSCVIIDKLPFAAPNDPVLQARLKKMEDQGGKPFLEYQLPQAVIALKQGIGRLLRDKNDYGVLMICDPRLKTRAYGCIFLQSLPAMPYARGLDDIAAFFARFEAGHGLRVAQGSAARFNYD